MVVSKNSSKTIGSAINSLFDEYGLTKDFIKGNLVNQWDEIIGKKISDKVKIDRFENDVLYLLTNSSVWRNEITMRKKELIEKINLRYGTKVVIDIQVR